MVRCYRYAVVVWLCCFGSVCYSASYDCGKVLTSVEEIICTTPLLSDFDVELSLLYNEAYEKADNKAEFRREQLDWLQSRNSCMDKNCVVNLYIFRLAKLRKLAAAIPNRSVFEVVDAGGLVGVSSSATIDIKACNTSANNINIIDGQ